MTEITKDELYGLKATISGEVMYHADAKRDSYYQGHLALMPATGLWVAWVEYDRDGMPGMLRAIVPATAKGPKIALTFAEAIKALNKRLDEKQTNNRSGRLYAPINLDAETGCITDDHVAEYVGFIQSMPELLAA